MSEEEKRSARKKAALKYAHKPETKEKARQRYLKVRDTVEFKERNTNAALVRDFGITLLEYNKMFESQTGLCALCGKKLEDNFHCVVDHDHTTGKVRGLLHRKCNSAIGFLGDSVDMAKKAWEYLEAHHG